MGRQLIYRPRPFTQNRLCCAMDRKCGKTYILRYLHFKLWSLITFFLWSQHFVNHVLLWGHISRITYQLVILMSYPKHSVFCAYMNTLAPPPTCRHCTVPPYLLHAPLDWSKEPPRAT